MIQWTIKREVVNADTQLSKVMAIRLDTDSGKSGSFFYKGCMKTDEEIKAAWDNIWNQHIEARQKVDYVDPVSTAGKTNLEAREV